MRHKRAGQRKPSQDFFVIIFEGRTGSSYTISCLNSHPNVLCYPEILVRRPHHIQKEILDGIAQGHAIEKWPQVIINPRYFHALPADKTSFEAIGLKTKLQDVKSVSHFFDYLHKHKFRLLYLKRHNVIKSALSKLNGRRLVKKYGDGHWNALRKEQVQGAFYVPPNALLTQLEERIRFEKWHQCFFELYQGYKKQFYYEDLLRDEKHFMLQVLNFLDVEDCALQGRFFKNTPDALQDAILNYDEIRKLFSNSYFDRFFVEDGAPYEG